MGYNSLIMIRNDAINVIGENLEQWWDATLTEMDRPLPRDVRLRGCGHSNPSQVVHNDHMDQVGLYAVGGNHASKLYRGYHPEVRHNLLSDQVLLLEKAAAALGYKVVPRE